MTENEADVGFALQVLLYLTKDTYLAKDTYP